MHEQMTEQEFWKRYLQSQRFHERNAGIKADDVFTRAINEEARGTAPPLPPLLLAYGMPTCIVFPAAFKENVQKKDMQIDTMLDLKTDNLQDYVVEEGPNTTDTATSKLMTQVS